MSKRTGIGILIILIGTGFLLQQAGLIQFTEIIAQWWPVIFIVIGAAQLLYHTQTSIFTGPFFIVIGALLLLNQWTEISVFNYVWPLIIIYVGGVFIFYQSKHEKEIDKSNMLNSVSIFGGSDIKSRSNPLKGGTVTAIFGGAEIDLRDAVIEDQTVLELTSLFGGISLFIPHDVRVEASGIPIFGGWEDKTRSPEVAEGSTPTVFIKCVTIFGGVEITN